MYCKLKIIQEISTSISGGSLRVTLVCAFSPKIWGGGGDLEIVALLEKECSFTGADNVRWWGH